MSWKEYIGNMRFWQQPRGSGDRSDLVIEPFGASVFNRTGLLRLTTDRAVSRHPHPLIPQQVA